MTRTRFILFTICLIFFTFSWIQCVDQNGAGVSAGACGASSSSSLNVGGDSIDTGDSGSGVDEIPALDGPIDLPVTIAKAIDGVDATTMEFIPAANYDDLINNSVSALYATNPVLGYIRFRTIDYDCTVYTPKVAVIIDGAITEILKVTSIDACYYLHEITADKVDTFLTYVVLGPNTPTTIADIQPTDQVSFPVTAVLISPDTGYFDDYNLEIIITNLDVSSTIAEAISGANLQVSVVESSMTYQTIDGIAYLLFVAVDVDETASLWRIPVQGGAAEEIAAIQPALGLTTSADNTVFFIDMDGEIRLLSPDTLAAASASISPALSLSDDFQPTPSAILDPDDLPSLPTGSMAGNISVHPSGDVLAYTGYITTPVTGESPGFYVISEDRLIEPTVLNLAGSPYTTPVDEMVVNFLSPEYISMTARTAADTYGMTFAQGFSDLLEGEAGNLEMMFDFQTITGEIQDIISTGYGTSIFVIGDTDGVTRLYRFVTGQQGLDLELVVDEDPNNVVGTPVFSADKVSYVAYQFYDKAEEQNYIAALNLTTDETFVLAKGSEPRPTPLSTQVAYMTEIEDTLQLAYKNISEADPSIVQEATALAVDPASLDTATNVDDNFFFAVGGTPPYTTSLSTEAGSFVAATGRFNSGSTPGDFTLTYTDSASPPDSVSASITINTPGNLVNGFGTAGITSSDETDGAPPSIYVQTDGKIIVVDNSGTDAVLMRYETGGDLDETFGGGDGMLTISNMTANDLKLDSDGNIYVCGFRDGGANKDNAIFKATTDGIADTSFATAGYHTADWYSDEAFKACTIIDFKDLQPYPLIYAGGYAKPAGEDIRGTLAVINSLDGSSFTGFGSSGTMESPFTGMGGIGDHTFEDLAFVNEATATKKEELMLATTGYMKLGGMTVMHVIPFVYTGQPIGGWGNIGMGLTLAFIDSGFNPPYPANAQGYSISSSQDGTSIFVAGTYNLASGNEQAVVIKLNTVDGKHDTGFGVASQYGTGAFLTLPNGKPTTGLSIDRQKNGDDDTCVIGGSYGTSGVDKGWLVWRIDKNGSADTSFGDDGIKLITDPSNTGSINDIDVDLSNYRIYMTGKYDDEMGIGAIWR